MNDWKALHIIPTQRKGVKGVMCTYLGAEVGVRVHKGDLDGRLVYCGGNEGCREGAGLGTVGVAV